MPGATVTLLADRRTEGALQVARTLTARLRLTAGGRPVVLVADPALRTRADRLPRDPGEVLAPASVPALLGRIPSNGDAVLAFVGPVRQQVIAALDRSSLVVLLTSASVPSLRAAQRTLRLLSDVGYLVGKVEVAIVVDAGTAAVDAGAVRDALRRDVGFVLARSMSHDPDAAAYDALIRRIRGA